MHPFIIYIYASKYKYTELLRKINYNGCPVHCPQNILDSCNDVEVLRTVGKILQEKSKQPPKRDSRDDLEHLFSMFLK